MTTTRIPGAEVRRLFEEVVELDARGRREVLIHAQPEHAREVEQLLAAAESAPAFLEDPASASELTGQRIGPWILEQRLSLGGTGEVYQARRADGEPGWRVALKLLRLRGDERELRRRFEAERRSLAVLAHPYIVPLVDAGWLEDGRAYLATRLVDGQPLDRHCASLDLEARLALFLRVCAAVQHAHQWLIAHCDLKPANILVTAEGLPQLLDFGIARLFAAEGEAAERALTPGYASPEQFAGATLAAASDVYSLGAVLHELVCGAPPERGTGGARRAPSSMPGLARGIARRLQGDFDAVVAKALAPEPGQRYASVAELAADLECFLERRPVRARPPTMLRRARLYLRRHAALSTALGVGLAALCLGLFSLRRDLEHTRAEASAGWRAHAQAALAARMLEDLARGAGPGLEQALDQASARLEREPELPPEAEGRLRIALGALYLDAGRPSQAREHLLRARELASRTRGFGSTDLERLERLLAQSSDSGGRR
ncbi:MAG: serine/threonine protein kinase [Planctomycetes bacterium]|nr:serine/threonine protein kinase [Planctomycetota bacterium]